MVKCGATINPKWNMIKPKCNILPRADTPMCLVKSGGVLHSVYVLRFTSEKPPRGAEGVLVWNRWDIGAYNDILGGI